MARYNGNRDKVDSIKRKLDKALMSKYYYSSLRTKRRSSSSSEFEQMEGSGRMDLEQDMAKQGGGDIKSGSYALINKAPCVRMIEVLCLIWISTIFPPGVDNTLSHEFPCFSP